MSMIDNLTDELGLNSPSNFTEKALTSKNGVKIDNSTTSEGFVHMSTVKTHFDQNIGVEEGQLKKELNFNS